jgi:hypothetical protein
VQVATQSVTTEFHDTRVLVVVSNSLVKGREFWDRERDELTWIASPITVKGLLRQDNETSGD